MPFITVELLKGRTVDQRREFAAAVTKAAGEYLNAAPERVRIRFLDIDPSDLATAGQLASDA